MKNSKKKKKEQKTRKKKFIIKLLKAEQWLDSLTKHTAQYNTISNLLFIFFFPHYTYIISHF